MEHWHLTIKHWDKTKGRWFFSRIQNGTWSKNNWNLNGLNQATWGIPHYKLDHYFWCTFLATFFRGKAEIFLTFNQTSSLNTYSDDLGYCYIMHPSNGWLKKPTASCVTATSEDRRVDWWFSERTQRKIPPVPSGFSSEVSWGYP